MPYSVAAKNLMLDELGALAVRMSVHDANPGSTGTNEAAGSTRGTITWSAAAAGAKAQSGNVSVTNIGSTFVVRYVGLWDSAGTTWYGYQAVSEVSTSLGTAWTYVATSGSIDLNAVASA